MTKKDTTSKDTHEAAACDKNKNNQDSDDAEAVQSDGVLPREAKGGSSSSKNPSQTQKEEKTEKTTFIVLQKNTRSLNSSERLEELFNEVQEMTWDVILISETWRQGKEIWNTARSHYGGIGEVHQQTRSCDTAEQKMEKSDQLVSIRMRTCSCDVDLSQQTTDRADECVHATQWLSRSSCRENIQNDHHDD